MWGSCSWYTSEHLVCQISALALFEVCQEPLSSKSILGRHWGFLTRYCEDWVSSDLMNHHDMCFFPYLLNFSSLVWLEVCQEQPVLGVHTWRTLIVPEQILGGSRHLWHNGLSWYVILYFCAKFQLSSMVVTVSVSRTMHPRSLYLEEIGS